MTGIETPRSAVGQELVQDCILRLKRDMAAGKLSFLGAFEEQGHVLVILDGKDPDERSRIELVCTDEADVEFITVQAAADLCMDGPADLFDITPDIVLALVQLSMRVTKEENMLAAVLSGFWGLAHFNGADQTPLLQVGVRSPLADYSLSAVALNLAQALEREYSLRVRGHDVEIKPADTQEQVRSRFPTAPAPVLPGYIAEMASRLEALTEALWAWHPGEILPPGICVFPEEGSETPAESVRFDDPKLTIIYDYSQANDSQPT